MIRRTLLGLGTAALMAGTAGLPDEQQSWLRYVDAVHTVLQAS